LQVGSESLENVAKEQKGEEKSSICDVFVFCVYVQIRVRDRVSDKDSLRLHALVAQGRMHE
jgi:hypothetical protein